MSFSQIYACYPLALPGGDRELINHGGDLILPPSALREVSLLNMPLPMLFELSSKESQQSTHCGVLEFTADEGNIYLPQWMLRRLGASPGSQIEVSSTSLPLGTFVKIEPQSINLLDMEFPKTVLEKALKYYSALTLDDIFQFLYDGQLCAFKVLTIAPETKSRSVRVDGAALKIEFAPSAGHSDLKLSCTPSRQAPLVTNGNQPFINAYDLPDTIGVKFDEMITYSQRLPSASPMPLNLPFGKLFFGYPVIPVKSQTVIPISRKASAFDGSTGHILKRSLKRKR